MFRKIPSLHALAAFEAVARFFVRGHPAVALTAQGTFFLDWLTASAQRA